MPAKPFTIKINSIMGGKSPHRFLPYQLAGNTNKFDASLGIDPDQPMTSFTDMGVLMPTSFVDFTSTLLNGAPMWLMSPPRGSELLYSYSTLGRLNSWNTSFGGEATVTTTGGTQGNAAQGGAYYNNYIYMAYGSSETRSVDIARWGPLDGTPALQESWWGSTIAQTPLDDPDFPTVEGITLPNHPMHVHNDGRLYIGDFDSSTSTAATRGRGLIHYIQTEFATDEGAADNGSQYNALDLPFNQMPVDIESYGPDLVTLTIPNPNGATFGSGNAMLHFWDTGSPSPYRHVNLQDPAASALLFHNGLLYIWSGSYTQGHRLSVYRGGQTVEQLDYLPYAELPPAGAVAAKGNRIYWGSRTTYPTNGSCVYAYNHKNANIPGTHNIINSDGGGSALVTSLLRVRQDAFNNTDLAVGWSDTSNFGIDRRSAGATNTAVFRSMNYQMGAPFRITKIIIPFGEAITSNQTLTVRLYESIDSDVVDPGGTTGVALQTINNTNFSSSERRVELDADFRGLNDFQMQLKWSGTNEMPVLLPIIIHGEFTKEKTA
ncbi:MAG: hypothetical protein CMB99_15400 [Flavobacteriaceae bacterium]|jgi:hypothetical protein|nr:hypothetical protein [Flavobacteriaceae bacterium]|tara:strand:+ start:4547 stop:6184 length:1638 start_codon:yes stop_codon:yes gene_type:complete